MIVTLNSLYSGPNCVLDCMSLQFDTRFVRIGPMLQHMNKAEFTTWGETLAVKLLEKGSLVDDIGLHSNMPTLHNVVEYSSKFGKLCRSFHRKY